LPTTQQSTTAGDGEIPAANIGTDASHDPAWTLGDDQTTEHEDLAAAPEGDSAAGLWALFLGLGLLMIGNGLNGAVIGVRSGNEGFSVVVTGVIMAGYFAGFLVAPSLVVKMIASVGHIRVFAGLASLASSAVLIHALSVLPVTWTAMRFVFGFSFAGLYIVIESWLAELSTPANRGRTLAVYMIVSMAGLGIGQYLIAVADPNGFRLFIVSSVLVSLALVPVTLAAAAKVPPSRSVEKVSIRELIGYVPTGVVGSFMTGASTGVLLGLAAVYATRSGLSVDRTAAFLIAPTIGAIALQWPIGRLSDRVSRRAVIFGVVIAAAALSVTASAVPPDSALMLLIMFGIGGTMFPLYSLMVSYTLDWTPVGKTVGAAGTLVRINGSGALVGPLVAAPLMSWFGDDALFFTMTAWFSVILAFVAYRIAFKEPLPSERQTKFVPFPARASNMAIRLVVRPVKATKTVGRSVVSRHHDRNDHHDPD
jgi:MFS family permease